MAMIIRCLYGLIFVLFTVFFFDQVHCVMYLPDNSSVYYNPNTHAYELGSFMKDHQNKHSAINIKMASNISSAKVGEYVAYNYVINNTGNSTIMNVSLTDNLFGTINTPRNILYPDESIKITKIFKVPAMDPNILNNIVIVEGYDWAHEKVNDTDNLSITIIKLMAIENVTLNATVTIDLIAEASSDRALLDSDRALLGSFLIGSVESPLEEEISSPIPPYAEVFIYSDPSGASIYVGANDTDKNTPAYIKIPRPGEYLIRLTKTGYIPCERNCEINHDGDRFFFELTKS